MGEKKRPLKIKLEHGHRRDCWAVKNTRAGTWGSPWGCLLHGYDERARKSQEPVVYLDAIGRKGRGARYRWLRFGCNDTRCEAVLRVGEMALLDFLYAESPRG